MSGTPTSQQPSMGASITDPFDDLEAMQGQLRGRIAASEEKIFSRLIEDAVDAMAFEKVKALCSVCRKWLGSVDVTVICSTCLDLPVTCTECAELWHATVCFVESVEEAPSIKLDAVPCPFEPHTAVKVHSSDPVVIAEVRAALNARRGCFNSVDLGLDSVSWAAIDVDESSQRAAIEKEWAAERFQQCRPSTPPPPREESVEAPSELVSPRTPQSETPRFLQVENFGITPVATPRKMSRTPRARTRSVSPPQGTLDPPGSRVLSPTGKSPRVSRRRSSASRTPRKSSGPRENQLELSDPFSPSTSLAATSATVILPPELQVFSPTEAEAEQPWVDRYRYEPLLLHQVDIRTAILLEEAPAFATILEAESSSKKETIRQLAISTTAAVLAADATLPVTYEHILRETHAKEVDKPLQDAKLDVIEALWPAEDELCVLERAEGIARKESLEEEHDQRFAMLKPFIEDMEKRAIPRIVKQLLGEATLNSTELWKEFQRGQADILSQRYYALCERRGNEYLGQIYRFYVTCTPEPDDVRTEVILQEGDERDLIFDALDLERLQLREAARRRNMVDRFLQTLTQVVVPLEESYRAIVEGEEAAAWKKAQRWFTKRTHYDFTTLLSNLEEFGFGDLKKASDEAVAARNAYVNEETDASWEAHAVPDMQRAASYFWVSEPMRLPSPERSTDTPPPGGRNRRRTRALTSAPRSRTSSMRSNVSTDELQSRLSPTAAARSRAASRKSSGVPPLSGKPLNRRPASPQPSAGDAETDTSIASLSNSPRHGSAFGTLVPDPDQADVIPVGPPPSALSLFTSEQVQPCFASGPPFSALSLLEERAAYISACHEGHKLIESLEQSREEAQTEFEMAFATYEVLVHLTVAELAAEDALERERERVERLENFAAEASRRHKSALPDRMKEEIAKAASAVKESQSAHSPNGSTVRFSREQLPLQMPSTEIEKREFAGLVAATVVRNTNPHLYAALETSSFSRSFLFNEDHPSLHRRTWSPQDLAANERLERAQQQRSDGSSQSRPVTTPRKALGNYMNARATSKNAKSGASPSRPKSPTAERRRAHKGIPSPGRTRGGNKLLELPTRQGDKKKSRRAGSSVAPSPHESPALAYTEELVTPRTDVTGNSTSQGEGTKSPRGGGPRVIKLPAEDPNRMKVLDPGYGSGVPQVIPFTTVAAEHELYEARLHQDDDGYGHDDQYHEGSSKGASPGEPSPSSRLALVDESLRRNVSVTEEGNSLLATRQVATVRELLAANRGDGRHPVRERPSYVKPELTPPEEVVRRLLAPKKSATATRSAKQ